MIIMSAGVGVDFTNAGYTKNEWDGKMIWNINLNDDMFFFYVGMNIIILYQYNNTVLIPNWYNDQLYLTENIHQVGMFSFEHCIA